MKSGQHRIVVPESSETRDFLAQARQSHKTARDAERARDRMIAFLHHHRLASIDRIAEALGLTRHQVQHVINKSKETTP